MTYLYSSAAILALSATAALAEQGYTSKATSNTAKGYVATAIDTVPGNGVGASGEQPMGESGATADMGSNVSGLDYAAEPEVHAQAGVDIDGANQSGTSPMVDPNEQVVQDEVTDGVDVTREGTEVLAGDADTEELPVPAGSEELADGTQNTMTRPIDEGGSEDTAIFEAREDEPAGAVDQSTQDIYAAPAPEIALEGWERLQLSEVTTEDLTGATVLDANRQDIGRVNELIVGMNGELMEAELSVGGYIWGIGAEKIRVSMDSLNIQQDLSQGEIQVFVNLTKDALLERKDQ